MGIFQKQLLKQVLRCKSLIEIKLLSLANMLGFNQQNEFALHNKFKCCKGEKTMSLIFSIPGTDNLNCTYVY